ncbi:hypothetical protein L218DRAFT_862694 [Marasmius fiardii PR-910]|nr:hypothetical protein L218DRAFT_862694 [Marasmius fiardii PR-910]
MSTPPPSTAASTSKKAASSTPQLIGDLPVARDEALGTFVEMSDNWYQYKSLGRSRELMESMTCECQFSLGDDPDSACGASSDCINRLTQVECLPDDCRCGAYCRNQRFQKKEYAPIEIVKTEMKGYGLRIEEDIEKDTFIYEYVGDVVNPQSFKKRMRDYANEGIEHFYFMMLRKDEFIDATKNGGIGRFANHSCNPNCYVAKWTVGRTVRMGIFSKRRIRKHEELTFNYNVDRYGHQAQTCYCGEPNCVGFIGGKTQTDVSSMDDLYLDALGITDEDELMEMKGTKKKKGKKIDDPDFMPQMKTIVEKEVPKVVQALRQVQSKKVLYKLLTRIKITEDEPALRQIMRLRGFSIMKNILDDHAEDTDIIALALQCMKTWPLMARNKVEDSQILATVQGFKESADEVVKEHANQLSDHWLTLELAYRIPKRNVDDPEKKMSTISFGTPSYLSHGLSPKRSRFIDADDDGNPVKAPQYPRKSFRPYPAHVPPPRPRPRPPSPMIVTSIPERLEKHQKEKAAIDNLIAAVAEEQAAAEAAAAATKLEAAKAEAEAMKRSKSEASGSKRREKEREKKKSSQTDVEKEANKEKRLQKLVGAIVVKSMSKYAQNIEHDLFKKYAKELTEKIAEREKKSSAYKEGKLETLSEDKMAKIKKYAKEYITTKVLRKVNKSGRHKSRSSSSAIKQETPSDVTPSSADLNPAMVDLEVDDDLDVDMDVDMDQDSDVDERNGVSAIKIEEEHYADEKGIRLFASPSMDLDSTLKKENQLEAEAWRQRPPKQEKELS